MRTPKTSSHGDMPQFQKAPSTSWLRSHARFSYYDGRFRVTMRKERRRGKRRYWYGYAKFEHTTVKAYAGVSEALSSKRLAEIAEKLQDKAQRRGLAP